LKEMLLQSTHRNASSLVSSINWVDVR
jgi:hypothetical protein